MCGICGIVLFEAGASVDSERLTRMCDAMDHRGPDGAGLFIDGRVGLGHRRLTIIDLHGGKQPLANEDESIWVTFNGEIYNHLRLRTLLEAEGHQFSCDSDTEVLVHAYEERQSDFLEEIDGMFAFAIYDRAREKVLLARDRLGIKPLYYHMSESGVVFASELKSLLASGMFEPELDIRTVHRFLTFGYLPGRETPLKNVFKVLPGEAIEICDGEIIRKKYWDLDFHGSKFAGDFDDATDELKNRFSDSINAHLMSDVPLGVLLSGGLDSSAVLAEASSMSDDPVECFTVGFEGSRVPDERPYAQIAADQFGANLHQITVEPADFFSFLPKYVHWMEELICEPPAISLFALASLASEHVKVVLSGEGGDECFAGYSSYRRELAIERIRDRIGPLGGSLAGRLIPSFLGPRARRLQNGLRNPLPSRYLSRTADRSGLFGRLSPKDFTPKFRRECSLSWSTQYLDELWSRTDGLSPLQAMLYIDTATWLPDDLLVKADKMTMANSIELRVPLLDHKLVEFAATLPDDMKIRPGSSKAVFRNMAKTALPNTILNRKKAGFPIPYAEWFRSDLQQDVADLLLAANSRIREILNADAISKIIRSHARGEDRAKEIFCMVILELWMREFLDRG
jgi:asparagine synthase (glutamine-hydrolysing)